MKNIKYSVIIPCYNIEKYISSLVSFSNAILDKRSDVEFIIIDDGSTDNTYKLCSKEQNFTVYNQNNNGVSSARNKGISEANGDFILFLDADDEYQLNLFEHLDKNLNTESEVIIFNYEITNVKNINSSKQNELNKNKLLEMFFLKKINICICAICFNLAFLKKNNLVFPSGYSFGEDIYFIIKSLSATKNRITYIPNKLFKYRIENSNTVKSSVNRNKISVINLYLELYNSSTVNINLRESLSYFTQRTYLYLVKLCFSHGISDLATLQELKSSLYILDRKIKLKTPLTFTLAKFFMKKFSFLIFIFLSKKTINHSLTKK